MSFDFTVEQDDFDRKSRGPIAVRKQYKPRELLNHFKQNITKLLKRNQIRPKDKYIDPVKTQQSPTKKNFIPLINQTWSRQKLEQNESFSGSKRVLKDETPMKSSKILLEKSSKRTATKSQLIQHSNMMHNRTKLKEQHVRRLKQQQQIRLKTLCTFSPKLKSRTVYDIDIIKRNQLWLQKKEKDLRQIKQNSILKQLQNCTFSPRFISKQIPILTQRKNKKRQEKSPNKQFSHSFVKIDYDEAKKQLHKRIKTLYM